MLSLLDHLNRRSEPTGGLLGGYTPSRELVDRATLLPIGQYEDGSLTFAWPGFLKDAYEGAVRSAVAQEGAPLYDDGGQYVSGAQMQPLDAFNAASIAPMAGVAARGAGLTREIVQGSKSARGPVGARHEPKIVELGTEGPIRALHTSGAIFDKFDPAFSGSAESGFGHPAYPGAFSFSPNERVSGAGGAWSRTLGAGKSPQIYDVEINADRNMMPDTFKPLHQQPPGVQKVIADHPELRSYFQANYGKYDPPQDIYRLFKTIVDNGGDEIVVTDPSLIRILSRNGEKLAANPDNASLPSLLGQSQQDTQLASADPQYDAYDLLQQMRRPPPSPFWIDFQALDQQQMMDPPQMTIPPERQSPERLIPLRDKW